MTPLRVVLPLPPPELSPNARLHYMARSRAVKAAREEAMWATASAINIAINRLTPPPAYYTERIPVALHFGLPDNRRRDTDGLLSACKAYLDGIADALGVDDSRFDLHLSREVRKGQSAVEITIGGE